MGKGKNKNNEYEQNTEKNFKKSSYKTNTKFKERSECNFSIKLAMWDFGQWFLFFLTYSDSKKCTGKKLERLQLIKTLPLKGKLYLYKFMTLSWYFIFLYSKAFKGIVLSPNGTQSVSPEDHEIVKKFGCCVVDCSWNKVEEIPFHQMKMGYPRLCIFAFYL
jgi:pre-rRNA-processing protein TSR3